MSCECLKAKPLPSCIETLILGSANTSFDYLAVFKTPDGRYDTYPVSFVYGEDEFYITDFSFRVGTIYDMWLTKTTAGNIHEKTSFTVDSETVTCLEVEFFQAYDENAATLSLEEQTTTLEDGEGDD